MTNSQGKQMTDQYWISVGQLTDIPVLGSRRVIIDEKRIALFRTSANRVFALLDQCPHAKGPLSDGIVHGNCVTCPLHNWVISLEDGEAQGADSGSTETYQVRIEEGEILLNAVRQMSISLPASKEMPATSALSQR